MNFRNRCEPGRAARRMPVPFVLVTGGKGGVGKSTLAVNLGVQLAREGRRVLLVDLDLGLANLHVLLGLTPERTTEDAIIGARSLEECIMAGPRGVDVLPASTGSEEMGCLSSVRRTGFLDDLARVAGEYDVILGDSAAGIGPDVLEFATVADRVLVVTTPEVSVLTDAFGLIKAIDQFGSRRGQDVPTPEVVVNLASTVEEAKGISHKLSGICQRFLARSPGEAGWLPRSKVVARSTNAQRPFALDSSKSLEQHCLPPITGRLASPSQRSSDVLAR